MKRSKKSVMFGNEPKDNKYFIDYKELDESMRILANEQEWMEKGLAAVLQARDVKPDKSDILVP